MPSGGTISRAMLVAVLLSCWTAAAPAQSVRVSVPEENLRKEPRVTSTNKLATVLEGARLAVSRTQGRWSEVTLEGWIWTPSVSSSDRDGFDLVVSKAGGENLREAPDGDARRLAVLLRGMLLDRQEQRGSWTRVRRTAWMWSGSLAEVTVEARDAPPPDIAQTPTSTEPEGGAGGGDSPVPSPVSRIVSSREVPLQTSPEGDTVAIVFGGVDLQVVAREGSWARARLEGWVWVPGTLPADSVDDAADLTPADLRANPEQYVGRRVRWRIQFVSLERAEPVRTDFYEGEPFLLVRPADRSQGFVYVAVPPELLERAEALRPLETFEILARVRTGRSALMGVPVLDLIAIE